jgi:hypothetical protein
MHIIDKLVVSYLLVGVLCFGHCFTTHRGDDFQIMIASMGSFILWPLYVSIRFWEMVG